MAVAASLLAGCATPPREVAAPGSASFSGRMAVRVDDGAASRSDSASFELVGSAEAGQLELSTALGTLLARARWRPGLVLLTTKDGERAFDDLDSLTRELLGESLPVTALFDWLRGQPWPAAASRRHDGGFEQLDWSVDTRGAGEGRIVAVRHRPPPVTVNVRLDAAR